MQWSHYSSHCMWTYMVQAPNTGPATIALSPSPTRYNHQLLAAHGTTRPTTCETINLLPVKPLTPSLQEDLHCQGNHQLLVELPARIGQMGTPPLKQFPFVEWTCKHILCCSVCACRSYQGSYFIWGSQAVSREYSYQPYRY